MGSYLACLCNNKADEETVENEQRENNTKNFLINEANPYENESDPKKDINNKSDKEIEEIESELNHEDSQIIDDVEYNSDNLGKQNNQNDEVKNLNIPFIIINDIHYNNILNFLEYEECGIFSLKKENERKGKTRKNEVEEKDSKNELYIKNYKSSEETLKKLIFRESSLDSISHTQLNEGIFFAEIRDDIKILGGPEIKEIESNLKKNDIFKGNFNNKIYKWANQLLTVLTTYVELNLNKKPIVKLANNVGSLYIGEKIKFPDNIEDINIMAKMSCWNIIYHTEEKKKLNQLHEDFDFIEDEINCNFFTTNKMDYLSMLIKIIQKQNKEKYKEEIKIKATILLNKNVTLKVLKFFEENNYFDYIDKILIIDFEETQNKHRKSKKRKKSKNEQNVNKERKKHKQKHRKKNDDEEEELEKIIDNYIDKIVGFFNDKNEIIMFFKENENNSMPLEVNKIITLDKYNNKYIFFHEKIANFYKNKQNEELFKESLANFSSFLSSYNKELKIKYSKKYEEIMQIELMNNRKLDKDLLKKQIKKKSLIESIKDTFCNNNLEEKERFVTTIKNYVAENDSFNQDFKLFLNSLEDKVYNNISYFVFCFMHDLNKYGKGLYGDHQLYLGIQIPFSELLLFKENENKIINLPFFSTLYLDKSEAETQSGINELSEEQINNRKEQNKFNVLINIKYHLDKQNIPSIFDISEFSKNESYLLLPYTFLKINKINIDNQKYTANIELNIINKNRIVEQYLTKKSKIDYDYFNNIVDIKKVKNILIHCVDKKELHKLKIKSEFLEEGIEGNFLVTNSKEYLELLLMQIKYENDRQIKKSMSDKEILIKFELILFESCANNTLKEIKEYLNYVNIIIMSGDKEKYSKEMSDGIIKTVLSNKSEIFKYIRENCEGSLLSLDLHDLITLSEYYKKYIDLHEIISKYYQEINDNYFKSTIKILTEYIKIKKPNITNDEINNLLNNFKEEFEDPTARNKYIINNFLADNGSFYKDFNNWLENPNSEEIKIIAYLIAQIMLNLNEYARSQRAGLRARQQLYCNLKFSFGDLILYKQNINKVISFLSPFSITLSKKYCENKNAKNDNKFSVLVKINYNVMSTQKPFVLDITKENNISDKDERLVIPFSFFKISDVIINEKDKNATIILDAVNKEKIIEKHLSNNSMLIYRREKEMIDCTKNKIAVYNVESSKIKINIFGKEFVELNKDKLKLIIEGEEVDLRQEYSFEKEGKNFVEIIENENINNTSCMFKLCSNLSSVDLFKNWNMKDIIDTSSMFYECKSLSTVNGLKYWNMSNVESISYMFNGCISLNSVDGLKNWNINKVRDIDGMFKNCSSLTSIDGLKHWNMNHIRSTERMFQNCSSLTNIDALKNWKMDSIDRRTDYMFSGCSSLSSIDGLKNWKMNKVIYTKNMFKNCLALSSIDCLKKWKLPKVRSTSNMFKNCSSVKTIDALKKWKINKIKETTQMFSGCSSLRIEESLNSCNLNEVFGNSNDNKDEDISEHQDSPNHVKFSYILYYPQDIEDAKSENNISRVSSMENDDFKIQQMSDDFSKATFFKKLLKDEDDDEAENNKVKKVIYNIENMNWNWSFKIFGEKFVQENESKCRIKINGEESKLCTECMLKNSGQNTIEIIEDQEINSLNQMFADCGSLTSIKLENWKNINSTMQMFENCYCLTSVVFKNCNLSNVTDARDMFSGCISLSSLDDLKNWDMENVERADDMFKNCSSLKNLDGLKNWEMNKVTNTNHMFYGCTSLTSIDALINWEMKNVYFTSSMFQNCTSLTSVENLKNWNMDNVVNSNDMFNGCCSITNINGLKNWNMDRVKYTEGMFEGCYALSNIDVLKNWNMNSTINTNRMFFNCTSLTNVDALSNWRTFNLYNTKNMFQNCTSLTSIEGLKNWDMSNVYSMSGMFKNCSALASLDPLEDWSFSFISEFSFMFADCKSLTTLDALANWKTIKVRYAQNMFQNCVLLSSIDALRNWSMKNVENIQEMFSGCSSLSNIDALQSWNLSKVENATGVFQNCTKLKSIDGMEKWNMVNVKQTKMMFSGCSTLQSINVLDNLKMDKVKDATNMFYGCASIILIDALKEWKMNNVISTEGMFANCTSLKSIEPLGNWKLENIETIERMFQNCKSITSVDALKTWNIDKIANANNIFDGCTSLDLDKAFQSLFE